ncbi:MAG: hypothetical protein LBH43_10920 [Treponema sp.]|jgi:hypothetical protein|nr:hypothetical protein [Treponema sp.]
MKLAELLLTDIFYRKDAANGYVLTGDNEFIKNDIINEAITHITDALENTFLQFAHKKTFLYKCKMYVDHAALEQALSKYSRDIFGQQRLVPLIKKINNHEKILNSMEKFGLKVNSFNPYIHKRVGCLFYWISMLKPFHIAIQADINVPPNDQYIIGYFNEICAYVLIKMMLGGCRVTACKESNCPHGTKDVPMPDCRLTMTLDKDRHFFIDFLYAAHFRKLSRSSLELFLSKSCVVPFSPRGTCPLTNISAQDMHLMFTLTSDPAE